MIKVTSLSHVFSIIHGRVIALPVDGMTKPLMMCEEGWQEIECQVLGSISELRRAETPNKNVFDGSVKIL